MNKFVLFIFVFLLLPQLSDAQLFINEVMAKNGSILADEAGEYDDWIEIYNAGSESVDLAGYFVTDNFTDPNTYWKIPFSNASLTTVPAGGYLILWADKDETQGANHLNFKLSAAGEEIVLIGKDGETVIDSMSFADQSENASFGRETDGSNNFIFFLVPTPNASNSIQNLPTTYSGLVHKQIIATEDDAEQWPGGGMMMVSYGMDIVGSRILGLRFREIKIPKGATITDAWIQFTAKDEAIGVANFTIQMDNSDNAAVFADVASNISNRAYTSASVLWEPAPWDVFLLEGPLQKTPNLSTLVQEVVNRPGWQTNNNMAFIFSGTGLRSSYSFDGIPEYAPRLFIAFEANIPTVAYQNIYINELAPNASTFEDETGDVEDWIEIYNGSNMPVNIGGLFLSDNKDNLLKWPVAAPCVIPPGQFEIIHADKEPEKGGLHALFNLSSNGESVILSQVINNQLVILDSITYPAVPKFTSFGRSNDGQNSWQFFGEITPNASNNGAGYYTIPPTILPAQGLFDNNVNVSIQANEIGSITHYTTNGAEPTTSDPVYTAAFQVSSSTVVRAKSFKDGFFPSRTTVNGYILNSTHELPVLHLTTDPKNLWDDQIGIYTVGTNGILGDFCDDPTPIANYYQDWERPAEIALFEPNGDLAFKVNAGIKISGKCSRKYPMKSINVFLRGNKYGDKTVDYPIFSDRDSEHYKRFRIRNGGNDFPRKMLQDASINAMLKEQLDYQSAQPVATYINGEYWGIMNLREKSGFDYMKRIHGYDKDEFDFIKDPGLKNTLKNGELTAFLGMYDFIGKNDLSDPTNYAMVQTMMNDDNFLDYWIAMIYIASGDWPGNNKQAYRKRKTNGRFKWQLLDTDISADIFGSSSITAASYNTLVFASDPNSTMNVNHHKSSLIFRKMLENKFFSDEFVQRSMTYMQLVFNEERTNAIIDSMAARIDSEITAHQNRWSDWLPPWTSYSNWLDGVGHFKNFFSERPAHWEGHVKTYFSLGETFELNVNYVDTTKGKVFIHSSEMKIPYNYTGSYFKNVPVQLTAVAEEGYEFVHWEETGETNATIFFQTSTDAILTPIFEKVIVAVDDLPILSKINIYPNPSNGFFNIEWKSQTKEIRVLSIYNMLGQKVWHKEVPFGKEKMNIDLSKSIGKGMFHLEIAGKKGKVVKKLIVF